jgi:hypothetical protein
MHEDVYDLYQRGIALLQSGDYAAAAVPLKRARELEPDKASIREALGRALFHSQPTSVSVAPCSSLVAITRRAARWRLLPACAPSAPSTARTATAPDGPRRNSVSHSASRRPPEPPASERCAMVARR